MLDFATQTSCRRDPDALLQIHVFPVIRRATPDSEVSTAILGLFSGYLHYMHWNPLLVRREELQQSLVSFVPILTISALVIHQRNLSRFGQKFRQECQGHQQSQNPHRRWVAVLLR